MEHNLLFTYYDDTYYDSCKRAKKLVTLKNRDTIYLPSKLQGVYVTYMISLFPRHTEILKEADKVLIESLCGIYCLNGRASYNNIQGLLATI